MEDYVTGIEIKESELGEKFLLSCLPIDLEFYIEPFYHQLVSIAFAMQFNKGTAFFHDMGVGKTACAINTLRAKDIRSKILVITVNAALKNWENEFHLHAGDEYKIRLVKGSIEEKNDILKEDADVFIINYEGIFRRIQGLTPKEKRSKKGGDYILSGLDKEWEALILDESRMVMHTKSIRTKVCMYIALVSNYRMLLTGMPIAKSIEEIFSQQYCLDLGEQFTFNFLSFRQKYFSKTKRRGGFCEYIPRPGSEIEVRSKMYKRGIRYAKEECLDLPDKIFVKRYVELEGDQKAFYDKLLKDKMNWIVSHNNKLEVRDLLIKFMQICGGWLKAKDEVKAFISNAKLKELYYLLSEELQKEKVVVIASFVAEQRGIAAFLKNKGIRVNEIISGMDSIEIDNTINDFDKYGGVIVMSPRVGGRAINLNPCHYPIFYSQDFDFEINRQVEDRFHRIGQKHNVTYTKLIARNTVDEKVIQVLSENKNLFDIVVEGKNIGELI